MKVLELFSGTRSIGKECDRRGWLCHSIDNDPNCEVSERADLLLWDPAALPFVPDVIWASPPCQSWSKAGLGKHRRFADLTPRTEAARIGQALVDKTLEIIRFFQQRNPGLKFFVENPRGMLRFYPPMRELPRREVFYCGYGMPFQKATHIWSNALDQWVAKGVKCAHGRAPHAASIQGSRLGAQAAAIPEQLVAEILNSVE